MPESQQPRRFHSDPLRVLLATTNAGKIRELEQILSESRRTVKVFSLKDAGIFDQAPESGTTFLENARQKAFFYSRKVRNTLVIAEDSGLVVPVLNNEPGIHSARYAGPQSNDQKNIALLLKKLRALPGTKAYFFTAAVVVGNDQELFNCSGRVNGVIAFEPAGKNGFGYDPVFYYPPLNKTFAQIPMAQKNRISHRYMAFVQIREFLENVSFSDAV